MWLAGYRSSLSLPFWMNGPKAIPILDHADGLQEQPAQRLGEEAVRLCGYCTMPLV
jgi:hypothetical protein